MQLVLFDVCETLVSLNSTYSFLEFLSNRRILPWYSFLVVNVFFRKLLNKIPFRFSRNFIAYIFHGLDISLIEKEADVFFQSVYKRHIIHQDLLEQYLGNAEFDVKLISASISMPIRTYANRFGIHYFASTLSSKDGKYDGFYELDLLGNKEQVFMNDMIDLAQYSKVIFYTDHISDMSLIKYLSKIIPLQICIIVANTDAENSWKNALSDNCITSYELIR